MPDEKPGQGQESESGNTAPPEGAENKTGQEPVTTPEPQEGRQESTSTESAEAKAQRLERELTKTRKEAAGYRTKLKDKEDAELSEVEKLRKQAQEAEQREKDRASELHKVLLRASIERQANKARAKDPEDIYRSIDTVDLMDEDGNIDEDAVAARVKELTTKKSYLFGDAQESTKSSPTNPGKQGQLTDDDLKSMTPEQIEAALKEGKLDKVLGRS